MLLLCIKIFFVRILDVSLGTIRTIVTIKEKNILASIIGFVEILIWFLIAKEAINENNSIFIAISYALGFSCGTYLGGIFANKLITTNITVQIVSNKADILINILRNHNYGITVLNIDSMKKDISKMLILEINIHRLKELKTIINKIDPKSFITVNESKYVFNGYLGN